MNPKIYLVGGAVRDHLLGIESRDRDYVVVGADVQYMLDRGFEQVGQSFPVFLHPETKEEYALARREKKVSPGYTGFEFEFGPHVTLEDDLLRRDLTINSMAMDTETNEIIDPYGGRKDLHDHVLRHTSPAFAEDPLRVLRVARFAARYGFTVAVETENLMFDLVDRGEIDALTNERIWTELYKILTEKKPSVGLEILRFVRASKTKALKRLLRKERVSTHFEEKLDIFEKIYHFLEINELSKDEANELRVPLDLWRRAKFYDQMISFEVDSRFGLGGPVGFDVVTAVKVFDQYRQEFKAGDIMKVKAYYNKCGSSFFDFFFNCFSNAVKAVDAVDFTDLVKGMNPKDIRDFVATTKQKVFLENMKC